MIWGKVVVHTVKIVEEGSVERVRLLWAQDGRTLGS